MPNTLPFRARLTYCAHMFKALTKQHHKDMLPLLRQYIPKDGVVIDVGAHAGQFMKLFSRLTPQGHVYAFEPGRYAYSIAQAVVAVRRLKNVSLFRVGLGDCPSEQTLRVPVKSSGSMGFGLSHIGEAPASGKVREEKITTITLDRFSVTHELKRIDFIKADIEGWEMRLLLGARDAIQKFKPVIFLEVNDAFLTRAGNSALEIWDFMAEAGYTIHSLREGKDGITLTPLAAPIANGDIWCVPN